MWSKSHQIIALAGTFCHKFYCFFPVFGTLHKLYPRPWCVTPSNKKSSYWSANQSSNHLISKTVNHHPTRRKTYVPISASFTTYFSFCQILQFCLCAHTLKLKGTSVRNGHGGVEEKTDWHRDSLWHLMSVQSMLGKTSAWTFSQRYRPASIRWVCTLSGANPWYRGSFSE